MEAQLLGEIKRLRKELKDAIEGLNSEEVERHNFHDELQETRKELVVMREIIVGFLAKKKQCSCECCTEGTCVYVDLEVSHSLEHIRCAPVD